MVGKRKGNTCEWWRSERKKKLMNNPQKYERNQMKETVNGLDNLKEKNGRRIKAI